MKVVDLNVLIYATDETAAHHVPAKGWLERALSSTETIGIVTAVAVGYVRLTTSPRVDGGAARRRDQSGGRARLVSARRNVMAPEPTPRHYGLLEELLAPIGTAGNLVSDAHLAALAIEHGAELCSFDRDFGRFSGLRWIEPDLRQLTAQRVAAVPLRPLATGERSVTTRRRSEHHELDVLAGEDRARGDEGVAADDEVLAEGVDVAEATLERAVRVQRASAAGPVGGGDDRGRPVDGPHGGGPSVRSLFHRQRVARRRGRPDLRGLVVEEASRGPQVGVGGGQVELEQRVSAERDR